MRKLAVEIHTKYQMGLLGALLPPHVSLKQPFQVSDLAEVESYFGRLTQCIEPFDLTLAGLEMQLASVNDEEYGILWLSVQENQALRDLHNRIKQELSEQFENTHAALMVRVTGSMPPSRWVGSLLKSTGELMRRTGPSASI
jgi:2'-5' RNA ligase